MTQSAAGRPTDEELKEFSRRTGELKKAVDILSTEIEAIYGMYMDSVRGWGLLQDSLSEAVRSSVNDGASLEVVLKHTMIHGEGRYEDGVALHRSPIGERIAACSRGGFNEATLSRLCLLAIYAHWEDPCRRSIADALGVELEKVMSPLFGDIRIMRNAIVHTGGVMDQRAKGLGVLKWFQPDDRIVLTHARFHELIEKIREFPVGLHTPTYKPSPSLEAQRG